MKKFLLRLILFLLPLAGLAAGMEWVLRAMPTGYGQKRDLIEARLPALRLLVLGASQENQGIAPGQLDPQGFNLAYPDQDYYYDRLLALKYLDRMPHLRLVIMELSYISLRFRLPRSQEDWRLFYYSFYQGLPIEDPSLRFDLRNFSAVALYDPRAAPVYVWKRLHGIPPPLILADDGHQAEPPLDDADRRDNFAGPAVKTQMDLLESLRDGGSIPSNLGLLEDLCQTLARRNVRVVFVTSPVCREYSRAMNAEQWAADQSRARAFFRPLKVDYFDYLRDPRFSDQDFTDVLHLNTLGADKFTRILAKDFAAAALKGP